MTILGHWVCLLLLIAYMATKAILTGNSRPSCLIVYQIDFQIAFVFTKDGAGW